MPTALQNRIDKDYKGILKMTNAMYKLRTNQIGSVLSDAFDSCVKSISAHLIFHDKMDYQKLFAAGTFTRMEHDVKAILKHAAYQMEDISTKLRRSMDLTGRLASSYLARKATPPWIPIKLDIGSMDGVSGPGKGLFIYYMDQLAKDISTQVQRAALNGESPSQTLKRVRALFNRANKNRMNESMTDPKIANQYNQAYDQKSELASYVDKSVDIKEGFYTVEDVEDLQSEQRTAMQWEHRQYRPWFSDSLKSNNRVLRQLETNFMSDMIEALHTGMLQVGSKNMGIKDFEWVVSRPQPKCDECTVRDGKTMTEVKTIRDKFKGQPPPLHPNCRCQLVPKINDEWAKKELEADGYEWDSSSGVAFNPTAEQKKLGFTKMNWDDWLSTVTGAAS